MELMLTRRLLDVGWKHICSSWLSCGLTSWVLSCESVGFRLFYPQTFTARYECKVAIRWRFWWGIFNEIRLNRSFEVLRSLLSGYRLCDFLLLPFRTRQRTFIVAFFIKLPVTCTQNPRSDPFNGGHFRDASCTLRYRTLVGLVGIEIFK